ncbi:hypothetical protein MSIMFI_04920 [Mycobacterium simulans]|nr:hypothetical protein MSIMFI_04920 [Mycobacterium simulans]
MMRDCTVTDITGNRADWSPECDSYWDAGAYVGGWN